MGFNYLKQVEYCTIPGCRCGIRCPLCNTNFVKQVGQVCGPCTSVAHCQVCGQLVKRLYPKWTKTKALFYKKYDLDPCQRCGVTTATNVYHTCSACHNPRLEAKSLLHCDTCYHETPNVCSDCKKTVDVIMEGDKCVNCFYGQGWDETQSQRKSECVMCHTLRPVDSDGFCKDCYVETNQYNYGSGKVHKCASCRSWTSKETVYCSSCRERAKPCAECGVSFVAQQNTQTLCPNCLPRCRGCGTKYVPLNREDVFCSPCVSLMVKGQCLKCGRMDRHGMDSRGHCHNCSLHDADYESGNFSIGYPCSMCNEEQVSDARGICDNCKQKEYVCPICKVSKISYKEYTCNSCAMNYNSSQRPYG